MAKGRSTATTLEPSILCDPDERIATDRPGEQPTKENWARTRVSMTLQELDVVISHLTGKMTQKQYYNTYSKDSSNIVDPDREKERNWWNAEEETKAYTDMLSSLEQVWPGVDGDGERDFNTDDSETVKQERADRIGSYSLQYWVSRLPS